MHQSEWAAAFCTPNKSVVNHCRSTKLLNNLESFSLHTPIKEFEHLYDLVVVMHDVMHFVAFFYYLPSLLGYVLCDATTKILLPPESKLAMTEEF